MVGKIYITRTGYDPQLGKHVKDPYLGPRPTLGACRPDVRERVSPGDHVFVISGKVRGVPQYVMGGFEVAEKIDAQVAYKHFPEHRLRTLPDGQLTGNIIVASNGKQHKLDDHNSFDRRIKNYVVGQNGLLLTTDAEISRGRNETLETLCDILRKRGNRPFDLMGRAALTLNEEQIHQLRAWLQSIKAHQNN